MNLIILLLVLGYGGIQYLIYQKKDPEQSFYRRISKISKNTFFVSLAIFVVLCVVLYISGSLFNPLVALIMIMSLSGISILSFIFELINQRIKGTHIQNQVLSFFYAFGIFCNFLLTIGVLTVGMNISTVDLIASAVGVFVMLGALNSICSLMVFLIVSILGLFNSPIKQRRRPVVKRDLMTHYEELGMTPSEIDTFRKEMYDVKQHILRLEESVEQTGKMRALALRYNIVAITKRFFKDIVEEANRINDAERFIYHFLPSLVDLVDKYNEIQGHIAKNKQTYLILERSANAIEQLMIDIIDEYTAFHEKNIQDLEFEVELAAKSRSRKETDFTTYSSESILNDFFDEDLNKEEEA